MFHFGRNKFEMTLPNGLLLKFTVPKESKKTVKKKITWHSQLDFQVIRLDTRENITKRATCTDTKGSPLSFVLWGVCPDIFLNVLVRCMEYNPVTDKFSWEIREEQRICRI